LKGGEGMSQSKIGERVKARLRVGKMGSMRTLDVDRPMTVKDVLAQANLLDLLKDGYEPRLNGQLAELDAPVNDNDTVTVFEKIVGG